MKRTGLSRVPLYFAYCFSLFLSISFSAITQAQGASGSPIDNASARNLFIDVHHFQPGSVTPSDVAKAHLKDLAVQRSYQVQFLKYWVNQEEGLVYCLSETSDSSAIRMTHAAAHGLLPNEIYRVTEGSPAKDTADGAYFLDIHTIKGVTRMAVEQAHQKDLEVQPKHHVHFLNYWVNEETGLVFCLSKARNADAVIATHRDAHALLPAKIVKVVQGE